MWRSNARVDVFESLELLRRFYPQASVLRTLATAAFAPAARLAGELQHEIVTGFYFLRVLGAH
jgi:hypothetical protein